MGEGYCKKCGEKIKKKHSLSNKLCGLCADDELNAHKCNCQKCGIEMISTRNPLPTLCSSCERDELNAKNTSSQTMKTRYQFIHFEKVRKVWSCRNNKMGNELGTVEFYHPWKQWVFAPTGPSIYSIGCLNDIAHFVSQLGMPCRNVEEVIPF